MSEGKRGNSRILDDDEGSAILIQGPGTSTETIDLSGLFTTELTTSGSFDIRSDIWATTFGKVLQALPIPALLVDQFFIITVVNQACGRISPEYAQVEGTPFTRLLPNPAAATKAQSLLEEVFSKRKPRVAEGLLQIDESRRWARMTFRSIRITDQRFILVLIEDLTQQKKQFLMSRKHEEELRKFRDELEKLVEERTGELKALNQSLEMEISGRRRVEEALRLLITGMEESIREERERMCRDLINVARPLVDQIKAEKLTDRAKHLVECIERDLTAALSSFVYDLAQLPNGLSPQELRICEFIRSGLSSKQIADVLGVAHDTVASHRSSVRKKLGLTEMKTSRSISAKKSDCPLIDPS